MILYTETPVKYKDLPELDTYYLKYIITDLDYYSNCTNQKTIPNQWIWFEFC
jgi:hypothetical protein